MSKTTADKCNELQAIVEEVLRDIRVPFDEVKVFSNPDDKLIYMIAVHFVTVELDWLVYLTTDERRQMKTYSDAIRRTFLKRMMEGASNG